MSRNVKTLLKNIHLFSHHNRFYAFLPEFVKLFTLTKRDVEQLTNLKINIEVLDNNEISDYIPYELNNFLKNLNDHLDAKRCNNVKEFQFSRQIIFMVNSSSICNLKCKYCYAKEGRFQYKNQPIEKLSNYYINYLMKILPIAFPNALAYNIHFYGGEPLLNLEVIKNALDYAENNRENKYTFTITTNGTLIDDEIISLFKRGKFEIIISIDGPSNIHDSVRLTKNNEPTHHLVLHNLNRLKRETDLSIRVSSVIFHNWTLKQARQYQDLLNVDYYKAQPVRLCSTHPLSLNEAENQEYLEDLTKIADEIIYLSSKNIPPKDDRFNNRIFQILRGEIRNNFCGAGINSFGLATDGSVIPCALLAGQNDIILGYIDDPKFKWKKEGYIWVKKKKENEQCKKCWAFSLCGGGCPAMLNVGGDLECQRTRKSCELALAIYGAFHENNIEQLLTLFL